MIAHASEPLVGLRANEHIYIYIRSHASWVRYWAPRDRSLEISAACASSVAWLSVLFSFVFTVKRDATTTLDRNLCVASHPPTHLPSSPHPPAPTHPRKTFGAKITWNQCGAVGSGSFLTVEKWLRRVKTDNPNERPVRWAARRAFRLFILCSTDFSVVPVHESWRSI